MLRAPKKTTAIYISGIRALVLGSKFLLSIYIAKYLGVEELGRYGLILGLAGLTHPVIGLGSNYFLAREVVGEERPKAFKLIRDRLALTTIVFFLIFVASFACFKAYGAPYISLEIVAIIYIDSISTDIHTSLISMEMPILANFSYFFRTSAWAFLVIPIFMFWEKARSFDVILDFWLIFSVAALLIIALATRSYIFTAQMADQINWSLLIHRIRSAYLIYVADICVACTIYADRYIIDFYDGLKDTGKFTFYWAISNGLYTLVSTSVISTSIPILVAARDSDESQTWGEAFLRRFKSTGIYSIVLGVVIFLSFLAIQFFFSLEDYHFSSLVFLAMLSSMIIRCFADYINIGIYSLGLDKDWATINVISVFISILMNFVFIGKFGIYGAPLGSVITYSFISFSRMRKILPYLRPRPTRGY